ncbi:MAG TPA: hypothetical protein VGP64_10655 [Polyangia bacterium]|jgi:hypothetical protein
MRAKILMAVGLGTAMLAVAPRAMARKPMSEEAQRRQLLQQLAAASADIPPEEKTDADLMYEAMRQWRGEPRGSGAVDQAIAQSKTDIRHDRKALEERVHEMFWKDPFSSEVVPVRKHDRDLLRDHAAHAARVRGDAAEDEIERLRSDLATVRAENARLREELTRAEGNLRDGDGSATPSRHVQARRHEGGGHSRRDVGLMEALNTTPPVHHHHGGSSRRAPPALPGAAAEPAPSAPEAATAPAGWHSSDPRGIIVVPIETPVSIHADKPSARAH